MWACECNCFVHKLNSCSWQPEHHDISTQVYNTFQRLHVYIMRYGYDLYYGLFQYRIAGKFGKSSEIKFWQIQFSCARAYLCASVFKIVKVWMDLVWRIRKICLTFPPPNFPAIQYRKCMGKP